MNYILNYLSLWERNEICIHYIGIFSQVNTELFIIMVRNLNMVYTIQVFLVKRILNYLSLWEENEKRNRQEKRTLSVRETGFSRHNG